MDMTNTDLFSLAERRLDWVERRQQVLAQNVANANTPGYEAHDIKPFEAVLHGSTVKLAATSPLHLRPLTDPLKQTGKDVVSERSPDGNAVSLDEELTKIADTGGMHELASKIYTKYMSMFRLALGKEA